MQAESLEFLWRGRKRVDARSDEREAKKKASEKSKSRNTKSQACRKPCCNSSRPEGVIQIVFFGSRIENWSLSRKTERKGQSFERSDRLSGTFRSGGEFSGRESDSAGRA